MFEFETNMYNLFYLLPIPIVNLTFGLGMGTTEMKCPAGTFSNIAADCSGIYDKGSASQWYASVGMPIIPLFDIHLSYRSITSKNVKVKGGSSSTKQDLSGTITGIGLAFNF